MLLHMSLGQSHAAGSKPSIRTLYLDTETTGKGPGIYAGGPDEILEVVILDDEGEVAFESLVRPTKHREWAGAQAIHGVSPNDVANAPTLDLVLPKITRIVTGARVVIYNAQYDVGFFPPDVFSDSDIRCAMLAYAALQGDWNDYFGNWRWWKLAVAASQTGFASDVRWHRAHGDTVACRHVWKYTISTMLDELSDNQKVVDSEGEHIPFDLALKLKLVEASTTVVDYCDLESEIDSKTRERVRNRAFELVKLVNDVFGAGNEFPDPSENRPSRVITKLVSAKRRNEVVQEAISFCKNGQQVYWVCPLEDLASVSVILIVELSMEGLYRNSSLQTQFGHRHCNLYGDLFKVVQPDYQPDSNEKGCGLVVIDHAERLPFRDLLRIREWVDHPTAAGVCIAIYGRPMGEHARARLTAFFDSYSGK